MIAKLNIKSRRDKVEDDIKKLKKEQQLMQANLRDADTRRYKTRTVCLGRMRNLSYRIQDLLETYEMKVESREGKGINKVLNIIQYPFKNLEKEIAEITQIIEVKKTYKEESPSLQNEGNQQPMETRTDAPDFRLIFKDVIHLLSFKLKRRDEESPVISICGMPGTRKTTLARLLYGDPDIQNYFDNSAWVDMGEIVEWRKILQAILEKFCSQGGEEDITEDDSEFVRLCRFQQDRKCLVVLDGVESLDSWKVVLVAIIFSPQKSKILLTTRMTDTDIAETVADNGYIHTMTPLNAKKSWELFKMIAFEEHAPDNSEAHKMMEELGKRIVRRCKGLPLAIERIAGIITSKHTVEEWKDVHDNLDTILEGQELASNFNGLPYHLKPCFLYLSFFPEEYEVEVEELYLFWMAEDMIASEDKDSGKEENRMKMAEGYLRELQERNWVNVVEEEAPTFKRFKSCCLQRNSLIGKFCLSKGKEEEFVEVIDSRISGNQEQVTSGFVPRLIVYLGKNIEISPNTKKYLRCLLIYDLVDRNLQGSVFPQDLSDLRRFKVLRVLYFSGVDFSAMKLPGRISKLKRLRYLSFKDCHLEALPEDIGSLPYLQVLDLRVKTELLKIPNILLKLRSLRHLYFPETFQTLSRGKLQLGSLTELETLKNFNTNSCNVEDLLNLTNLRCLTCNSTGGKTKGIVKDDLELLARRITMVTDQVLYCSVDIGAFECYAEERHSVFRQLLGGRALHSFSMKGFLGKTPSYDKICQRLAEIVLGGSKLKEDAMLEFQKLPHLRVLVLDDDAFIGEEMHIRAECFYELRRLQLSKLRALQKLIIADRALPKLSDFKIRIEQEYYKRIPRKIKKILTE